jgi:hypothetical protein
MYVALELQAHHEIILKPLFLDITDYSVIDLDVKGRTLKWVIISLIMGYNIVSFL